jgi:uncharacterized Fe-S cluster protein YjdI/CDGSH-type Zn-finger protein
MGVKDYRNDEIVVHWDAVRCIHTGICTRRLPGVFDVTKRPWISIDGATADQIAETVAACPTGALRYDRLDGGPAEAVADTTTVTPMRNGPLYVRGRLRVTTSDGRVLADESRLALCRCGASGNPPFCDNSHRAVGYQSPEAVPASPVQAEPDSPADICERQDF